MFVKKILPLCLFFLSALAYALDPLGQTVLITTNFKEVCGKPSWLLIIREVETGKVSPYLFEIRNNNNYWISYTFGHSYCITASILRFGPLRINNFCQLENGIISGKSMNIELTGTLSPIPSKLTCHVTAFPNTLFSNTPS